MEPQELITAKLVLGYLRSEKCKSTYKDFLRTSPNLRHLDYAKYKYMRTRYLGHTLDEILSEYFEISQIIQGRLEATNYYNEDHPKTSLVEQLLYLLNKVPPTRTSTPITSTPHGSQVDQLSSDHSDVEATPVHTLPGNVGNEESYETKATPKRKSSGRYGKTSPTPTNSPVQKNRAQVFDTEVLAHNLMENTEFQEKIAQTINKVVERQYKERDSQELDKTIKTAVEETEADPIFEELLQEIIGSSNTELNKNLPSTSANCSTSKNVKEKRKDNISNNVNESYSKSNQSVQGCVESERPVMDSFNQDIEQALNSKELMISYDSFNNYTIASNCNVVSRTPCIQNPVYINTMTGLIIPNSHSTVQPLVVLNNPAPITAPAALSEQEIMKMPIFLKESNEVLPNVAATEKQGFDKSTPLILPKPTIKVAPEAAEDVKDFFKNYLPTADDPSPSKTEAPDKNEKITRPEIPTLTKQTVVPKKTGLKKVIYPKSTRKSPRPTKRPIPTSKAKNDKKPTLSNSTENNDNKTKLPEDVIEISSSERLKTPAPAEPVKKPTPKSGSHVRNLNFSTPPKVNIRRKSNSPKSSQQMPAVKTLFKQTEQPWDAALRAVILNQETDSAPLKPQTSNGSKKTRKRNKVQLNATTEHEALLLEAAIRTPMKSNETEGNKSVVENIEEQLDKEDSDEYQNKPLKTILSPSKISNASKHILETKGGDGNTSTKFITPDMLKQNATQPIKANRNITPMLETPIKICPTPGASTPIDVNMSVASTITPFTKMLEANLDLKGIDIGSIPTPNLPITPDFPSFTPTVDLISPYSNRPTDYSTGSSYYQPSDNEQNKHLEAHLREMEKTTVPVEIKETISISDHVQMFNKSIIGKKNLSLMRKSLEHNNDTSESSSSEDNSVQDWNDITTNDTVIFKKKIETPKRYSLRTRSISVVEKSVSPKKKTVKTPKKTARVAKKEIRKPASRGKKIETDIPDKEILPTDTSTENIKTILNDAKTNPANSDSVVKGVTPSQLSVLKDLERKRLRMLNSLKTKTEPPKTKKQPNSKFKIKPIANVYTSKKIKKSESPKKRKRTKELETVLKDLITSDDSEIELHLSEEELEKENKLLKIDKADKTASDVEAQTLIEGLKERGIHLMHNKSPKKKNADGEERNTVVNTSSTQLETFDREAFDIASFDGEDIKIVYDESQPQREKLNIVDDEVQYIGQLFLESIGKEVKIRLKLTQFESLIDIESAMEEKQIIENKKDEDRTQKEQVAETVKSVKLDSEQNELNSAEKQSLDGTEEQKISETKIDTENKNINTKITASSKQSDNNSKEGDINETKEASSVKNSPASKNKQTSEIVHHFSKKPKIKTKQTPENKKEKLENKIEVIKETSLTGIQHTTKTTPTNSDNKKPKTDGQKPENKKTKLDNKVESIKEKTEISPVTKPVSDKKIETTVQEIAKENKKDIKKMDNPTTETKKEKPLTETKKERRPTTETKTEKPTTETKKEQLTIETKKERPATETKKAKPITETKRERLSTETKKEKQTTESKKEKQVLDIKKGKQADSKSGTTKEEMAKIKLTETPSTQKETAKKSSERELKIEILKRDNIKSELQKTQQRRDSNQSGIEKDAEDDLMNFAITGKEAETSSGQSTSTKRRLSDEDACENPAKKMLKSLDVDKFLNTIHAGTKLGQRK